ncbi:MAG: tripartite tricarboxylate transporter substrate binding protein [Alphaproteobacteria bacterium]|nr:tripartite tricarboxylate transporter substrate binding protein [Alphaproteobacteria bacterium]
MKNIRYLWILALAAVIGAPLPAAAEYPDRPITLIIPLGPGGSHDLHARGITGIISDILGQPMVVRLVPGAGGMKGTSEAAKAKADGYTLLFTHNAFDQLKPQTVDVNFNTLQDFKTVARINFAAPILVARADQPYKTFEEFVAYAKANPGKVNMGHSGVWGPAHIPASQLIKETGIKVNLIPHKGGGPALQALLAGEDQVTWIFATQTRPHYLDGKVRVLAVAGDTPLANDKDFKDVPTMAALGYSGVAFTMDRIFMAPAGMNDADLKKLRDAFEELMDHKSFQRFITSIGEEVMFMRGEEYDKLRPGRYESYTDLIKSVSGK